MPKNRSSYIKIEYTFGHGFEMDDTELLTASHPEVIVIPSAVTMGEREITSGKEFITAIVARK